jgi:hypothetical protein
MTDLKQLSAVTALNNMMSGGHFNICTIDSVAALLEVQCRGSDAYRILHTLHCVDWGKMPPELRAAVPDLIKECLGIAPVFQFTDTTKRVIDITPPKQEQPEHKRGGFLRLLGR